MNVTVEKLPKCLTEVTATFPAETVKKTKDSIMGSLSSQAAIPGFRPGKAPKRVIEKRYSKEIEADLEYKLISDALSHSVKEEKLNFLDIKDQKITHEQDGSATSVITLIVSPEFELGEYKGIPVTVPELEVTDETVDEEILRIRQQQAQYPTKEEGAVESGDIAVISYTSSIDGQDPAEVFEEELTPYDKKDEYWIKAGEDHFLPGFSEELLSMVPGSEKKIDHTFADTFAIEVLRGKTFTYNVTVTEVKEEQLPEVEDMVKQMLGDDADVDSFKERVELYLKGQQEKAVYDQKVNTILDKIGEGLEFDLPEEFLTAETQSQADRLVNQGMNYGLDEEAVVKMQESIIETAEKNATQSLKNHFILQKIAKEEEITVEDMEVQQRIFMDAYQQGQDPQKALKETKQKGGEYSVRQSILMDKVIDFLIEEADVTTENVEKDN